MKPKVLLLRITLKDSKILVQERLVGQWSVLDEIAIYDVLKSKAHEKLNQLFHKEWKNEAKDI